MLHAFHYAFHPRPALVLTCALSMVAWLGMSPVLAEAPSSAEEAGWELSFEDDFQREALGEHWKPIDGEWAIEDGALVGVGTIMTAQPLFSDLPRDLPGEHSPAFQRLEFEVRLAPELAGEPAQDAGPAGLGAFIHTRNPEADAQDPVWHTGYHFELTDDVDGSHRVLKAGKPMHEAAEPGQVLVPGEWQRVVVENDEGQVRLFIDGELVLEQSEQFSILSSDRDRLGFHLPAPAEVRHVKIYIKQLKDDFI